MHIQQFTMSYRRVPDPMRPGRTAPVGFLTPSGNSSLAHSGETYEPDASGWFDVPHDVGIHLCSFRNSGSGYYTPGEVEEQVRLGFVEKPVAGPAAKPKGASARRQARLED